MIGLAIGPDVLPTGLVPRAALAVGASRIGSGFFLGATVFGGVGGRTRIRDGLFSGSGTGSGACGIIWATTAGFRAAAVPSNGGGATTTFAPVATDDLCKPASFLVVLPDAAAGLTNPISGPDAATGELVV